MRKFALIAAAMLISLPAGAAEFVSAYTDVDLDACEMISSDEVGATWACEGLDGYPVYTTWTDPHPAMSGVDANDATAYSCVKNNIVGIGDIFTRLAEVILRRERGLDQARSRHRPGLRGVDLSERRSEEPQ